MSLPQKEEKKDFVQEKFASVTEKYDFLNSLLSFGIDHLWRRSTIKTLSGVTGPVLDLCAGTLPLTKELFRQGHRDIVALDFCFDMLKFGVEKNKDKELINSLRAVCGDGENLPLKENSFSGFTVAFGIRNLSDLPKGFSEVFRILKPGGKGAILEFSRPTFFPFKILYFFYLQRILPQIGGLISGDKEAYRYLAESIKGFCSPKEVCQMLKDSGFTHITYRPMTLGIVTLYQCQKPL